MDSKEIKVHLNTLFDDQALVTRLSKEFSTINPSRKFGKVQWKLGPDRWKNRLYYVDPNEKERFLDEEIYNLLDYILEQKKATEQFRGLQFSKRFLMLILEYYHFLEYFLPDFVQGRLDSFLEERGIQESENGVLDINPVPIKLQGSDKKFLYRSKIVFNYIFFNSQHLTISFEYLEQGHNVGLIEIQEDIPKGFGLYNIFLNQRPFLIGGYRVRIIDDQGEEIFSDNVTILPPKLNIAISPKILPSSEILIGEKTINDRFFSIKRDFNSIILTFSPKELVDEINFKKNVVELKIFEKTYETQEITQNDKNILEINLIPDKLKVPIQYFINNFYESPIMMVDLCQFFCFIREENDKHYFKIQFSHPIDVTLYLNTETKQFRQEINGKQESRLEIDPTAVSKIMELILEYQCPSDETQNERVQYHLMQKQDDLRPPTPQEIERAVDSLLDFLKKS